jgi:outer membrane protein assembly factor BamE (lipoprotein component of BamABCDE complex)
MLLLLSLGACSLFAPNQVNHGAQVQPDQLRELVPGTSTKNDVTSVLGSPTARATFDDNTWIYISETTHNRIGMLPGISKQNVVVLRFDQGGTLRQMQQLGMKDSQSVNVIARTTPSPGTEATFLQQLLGNVGRFNPGSSAGSTGGGSTAGAANLGGP